MSEEYAVLSAASGIVGVPVLQYCYSYRGYPDYVAPAGGLTDDEFARKYGFARVTGANKPYYWRAGPIV